MNKLNLAKNCKLLAIFLSVLLVGGCDSKKAAPINYVYGDDFTVYSVTLAEGEYSKYGQYEYWITDATSGWLLRSSAVFNVGDKVSIVKSN